MKELAERSMGRGRDVRPQPFPLPSPRSALFTHRFFSFFFRFSLFVFASFPTFLPKPHFGTYSQAKKKIEASLTVDTTLYDLITDFSLITLGSWKRQ